MEKKKTNKKWREIRSAVTMMCVMAAMLSSATFAWFTLTSSPTVTGMQMTAASQGGLVVSESGSEGSFENAITLSGTQVDVKYLKPVTPDNASGSVGFREPVYTGGNVNGLGTVVTDATGYVAKYEYYLQSEDGTVKVGVIGGKRDQAADLTVDSTTKVANASGTVVRQKGDEASPDASDAIRIGLLIGNESFENLRVIEVNCDEHITNPTSAPSTVTYNTAFDPKVSFTTEGNVNGDTSKYISPELFEVGEDAVKVTMYVWLEGTDVDCANQIMADELEAQIQFTIVEGTTTP